MTAQKKKPMSYRVRSTGYDAVDVATKNGWGPGTKIMSAKSWTVAREIVRVETWCVRLMDIRGTGSGENTASTVYKTLPSDTVEVPQTKPRKIEPKPGYSFVQISEDSEEMRLAGQLSFPEGS